jgi:hypothetical protein
MTIESSVAGSDSGYHRPRFSKHNFSGYCFNTLRCSIEYDGRYEVQTNDPSGSPLPSEMESLEATTIGIPNFPSPVAIHWTSMDGQSHEDQVDLSQIFEHREVIHRVPPEKVARDVLLLDPGIILIVNDRSVSVYMRALIPLSEQRTDGVPRRKFIDEPVLVYKKDY